MPFRAWKKNTIAPQYEAISRMIIVGMTMPQLGMIEINGARSEPV